jgi:hypothetical protein
VGSKVDIVQLLIQLDTRLDDISGLILPPAFD